MRLRKAMGPATLVLLSTFALCAPPLSAHFADRVGASRTSSGQSQTAAKPQSTASPAPATTAPIPAPNPLNDIAWMKGGVWVAEMKDAAGAVVTRIESRVRGSE